MSPSALPPGQREVARLPVRHVGEPPPFDGSAWSLSLTGELDRPRVFTLRELRAISTVEIEADFHAAAGWSVRKLRWRGARLCDVLAVAAPRVSARFVRASDGLRYDASLALSDALEPDVLLATALAGETVALEHGGPLRLLVPARYGWKSVKWLRSLELHAEERPGFWERRGFHPRGDPWKEERLS
ncbi:MAG: sulfite oxidase-like oxidoreductase [Planctomycetes bacterium]|nr:sulfite oxidase-like oxidoreductase [Planctomycetota bacterium]